MLHVAICKCNNIGTLDPSTGLLILSNPTCTVLLVATLTDVIRETGIKDPFGLIDLFLPEKVS